jgi:hypothetical protein
VPNVSNVACKLRRKWYLKPIAVKDRNRRLEIEV